MRKVPATKIREDGTDVYDKYKDKRGWHRYVYDKYKLIREQGIGS